MERIFTSIRETGSTLGLGRSTIYRMINEGQPKAGQDCLDRGRCCRFAANEGRLDDLSEPGSGGPATLGPGMLHGCDLGPLHLTRARSRLRSGQAGSSTGRSLASR